MNRDSLEFLRKIMETPSPSGFEVGVQKIIRERLKHFADDVKTDVHGNVIGVINRKASLKVMLAGHCDEIGLMVIHIDDQGYAYFAGVGGVDPSILSGKRVVIHNQRGNVTGVIGKKPIHLMTKEEREKVVKMHEQWIDIGAKDRKDAESSIALGDYVTIDHGFAELKNDLVAARAFDDRCGAFVVVETLRRLKKMKCNVAVYGVSTVQEEIGLRGARTSAYGINPDVGIAIDVGFGTDFPSVDPKIVGECKLGKGPQIHRGPNINPVLGPLLEETARKKKIPYQVVGQPKATGTDANIMQVTGSGVATALISIPNRYMHTPSEVISLDDLDNASLLLAEFLSSLKPDTSFIPV